MENNQQVNMNETQQDNTNQDPQQLTDEQKRQIAKQKRKEKNEQMKKNNEEYLKKKVNVPNQAGQQKSKLETQTKQESTSQVQQKKEESNANNKDTTQNKDDQGKSDPQKKEENKQQKPETEIGQPQNQGNTSAINDTNTVVDQKNLTEEEKRQLAKQKRKEKNEQMKKNNAEYLKKKQEVTQTQGGQQSSEQTQKLDAESQLSKKEQKSKIVQQIQSQQIQTNLNPEREQDNKTEAASINNQNISESNDSKQQDGSQPIQKPNKQNKKKRSTSSDIKQQDTDRIENSNQNKQQKEQSQQQLKQSQKQQSSNKQLFQQQQQGKPQTEKIMEDQSPKLKQIFQKSGQHLLDHLQNNEEVGESELKLALQQQSMHPSILEICIKFKSGLLNGANNFCFAFLNALKNFIIDFQYQPSNSESFAQQLEKSLTLVVEQMGKYKKKTEGMHTAFVYCLRLLTNYLIREFNIPVLRQKKWICEYIDKFIDEKIINADQLIVQYGSDLVKDDDYIIVYGKSRVIESLLIENYNKGKRFTPIIVDNAPFHEGKQLLKSLQDHGIDCIYTLLSHVSYFIKKAKKIFVGASSMLYNGALISRVGTALLACLAKDNQKQFFVFCETYKFSKKCLLDSLTWNEMLINPQQQYDSSNKLVSGPSESKVFEDNQDETSVLNDYISKQQVNHINLRYDLTPCENITMVVTEIGKYPPSAIPQIIREFENSDIIGKIIPPKNE